MAKIRNIVVAIPAIIFVLAIILIFRISFSLQKGEVPKIFGLTFMEVQTGSMEPEIHQYDFIVNKEKQQGKWIPFRSLRKNGLDETGTFIREYDEQDIRRSLK